jgi:hypothetical protein
METYSFRQGNIDYLELMFRSPYCAEKYDEITIGPFEADKNCKNIPGSAPGNNRSYYDLMLTNGVWGNELIIKNNNNNNNNNNDKSFVKCYIGILHLGLFVIAMGGCICIDILFKYYKNPY